jgi:ABC-type Zn uptake system ZnuABC Zn-binding protein ZnuA
MTVHRLQRALLSAVLACGLVLAACDVRADDETPGGQPLNVVATTTQVQDFARNVGADRVNVLRILPGDADPHEYQPTAEDARRFAQADVVFYNGAGLETWLDELAHNTRPGVPVVNLAEAANLTLRAGEESEDEPQGGDDPHIWFDPTNVQKMVNVIRDTLSAADPAGASTYATNTQVYSRLLDQLDTHIQAQIETIPAGQRKMVTNHDAFGYYIGRYGLEFVGSIIPSLSTEAQPSASETRKLIQKIKDQGVKAIFTERSLNPRLEQQIAQQADVRVVSDLYGDSLGPEGSDGDTYLKMMQFNTQTIVDALK